MRGWKTADPLPAESSDPSCSRRLVAMRKLASGGGGGVPYVLIIPVLQDTLSRSYYKRSELREWD
jgi:hypothetical protein